MTTIKSSAREGERTLDVIVRNDGLVNLSVHHAGFNCGIQISTAALCAALGFEEAVRSRAEEITNARSQYWVSAQHHRAILDKRKAEVDADLVEARKKLAETEDDAATAQAELRAVTAERDELAATIDRVREAVGRHPEPCTETEFSCGWKRAVADIRAALDPKPAFALPKAFGEKFWAKTATNMWVEFKVCRNYSVPPECEQRIFVTAGHAAYDDRKVMRLFKDHTLEQPEALRG